MMKAVLFRSRERFDAFQKKLAEYGIDCTVLDFENNEWVNYDFTNVDMLIYYPSFEFTSNHPLALQKVYDNLTFIAEMHPDIAMFPDPKGIKYYNDKYRQFLFLNAKKFPILETIPLYSEQSVDLADRKLGYPMIIKNRFGAGGGAVFKIDSKRELKKFYRMSKLDLFHLAAVKYFAKMLKERLFYWQLIKNKKARFPFFSSPMLAQKFVKIDRDLKTVVGDGDVVEAHWRYQADESMWKMNIDGGGTGVWGYVPQEAIDLSIRLAKDINVSWLNLDFIIYEEQFYISEFSPVWHHYKYKEKQSFVYRDDYNIKVPLEISLDLERIIVESLLNSIKK